MSLSSRTSRCSCHIATTRTVASLVVGVLAVSEALTDNPQLVCDALNEMRVVGHEQHAALQHWRLQNNAEGGDVGKRLSVQ